MAQGNLEVGSIHETDAEVRERDACNAAFLELGLSWHWDAATFGELKHIADDGQRIGTYVETREPHLLKAYDARFLIDAVLSAKAAARVTAGAGGRRSAEFATARTGV